MDILHGHRAVEVKTGLVSNQPDAQKWRLTIGEPGKDEKAWIKTASDEDLAAWNQNKQQAIIDRKDQVIRDATERVGHPVTAQTMAVILDPDRKVADVHVFDGFHQIIRWRGDHAKSGYVGSFSYD